MHIEAGIQPGFKAFFFNDILQTDHEARESAPQKQLTQ